MADPVSVERLVRLGLTLYEARAYVALVRRDASTPAEVARLAGVPRPRIYDVLESLVGKGLAEDRPGRTAKYVATPPERVAAQLMLVHRDRVAALDDDARDLVDELRSAYQAGQQHTDPLDYIEVIRSPEAVATKFNELQGTVEQEMLVFSKAPVAVSVDENVVGLELARRGVLRSMYEFSVLEDASQLGGVRAFLDAGEEARFVDELPMKLGIIDERTVLFAMPDPIAGRDDITTLVIENPHLARTLKIGFESVWATGVTFAQACQRLGIPAPRGRAS
ncbi:MAG TPA: helix-turn-helix domain-containing protein [Jatrophihabitantaceae bacterium]